MDKLKVHLENCYGINKLEYEFEFTNVDIRNANLYAIYASNGCMKSSFTKTFDDIVNGRESKDMFYPDSTTKRYCLSDLKEILPEEIFIIHPFDESYSSKQMSKLLVNEKLKIDYDTALEKAEEAKKVFLSKLKEISKFGGKTDSPEAELCKVFGYSGKDFAKLLAHIKTSIPQDLNLKLQSIDYGKITNQKAEDFLLNADISKDIEEYVNKYDQLIEESPVLTKTFNHSNAGITTKTLNDTGFFGAKHSVNLKINDSKKEYSSYEDLNNFLKEEQSKLLSEPELAKRFESIDKKLKNAELRTLRDYLYENQWLLSEIVDFPQFKRNIWYAYLELCKQEMDAFLDIIEHNKKIVEEIIEQAKEEKTQWSKVVEIFNERFSVPFTLSIENQDDVILHKSVPNVKFTFDNKQNPVEVDESVLRKSISQGEKRALYLLNILFEIESRKPFTTPLLFIVDDIADSFDYKNKYAIIEYLYALGKDKNCKMIILSHNFDFYRTIASRMDIFRSHRLFARRSDREIFLYEEKYQKDLFLYWKNNLNNNRTMAIASIPFVRNLADYMGFKSESKKLTSLLHIKNDTFSMSFKDLEKINNTIIHTTTPIKNETEVVYDSIMTEANNLFTNKKNNDVLELENKIVLSIAIRLLAERFIIKKLNDKLFVDSITENQTQELVKRFIELFPNETETIRILESVNIMTPEGIHLNSFMYEPILDMSPAQLFRLYDEVCSLK